LRKIIIGIFLISQLFASLVFAEDIGLKGISSIKLESVSVDNVFGFNHLRLVIQAKKADNFGLITDIKKAIQKSLEYFFISLTVPDEKFWVNLNPQEPFRIIDSTLADTDLGRIMLNADLKLKEDISEITNPQISPIGKEFWRRLYVKAEELGVINEIPVMTRLWIVPDEAIVSETGNKLSILKAKLKVCLESAYLSQDIEIKDKRQKELQDFSSVLMEELVLPLLNNKVNKDYSYADLREVYQALILAKWYKDKFSYQQNSLLRIANADILEDIEINLPYSPDKIYKDYLKSLKNGEYSFTETSTTGCSFFQMILTKHYFSGGVDFRNVRTTRVNDAIKEQAEEGSHYVTCDLYIPQGAERPLQYAKNNLELNEGNLLLYTEAPFALAKNLPAIAPINFAERRIQNLDSVGRMERLVFSKL